MNKFIERFRYRINKGFDSLKKVPISSLSSPEDVQQWLRTSVKDFPLEWMHNASILLSEAAAAIRDTHEMENPYNLPMPTFFIRRNPKFFGRRLPVHSPDHVYFQT